MKMNLIGSVAALAMSLTLGAASAVASPITIKSADGTVSHATLTCEIVGVVPVKGGCYGYWDGSFGSITLSEAVTVSPSNPAAQLAKLNDLLGLEDGAKITEVSKTDSDVASFSVNRDYFSVKFGTETAYFKNFGGLLNITYTKVDGSGISHHTQYGGAPTTQVPEPTTLALLGLGLLGLGYRARRRQAV